MLVVLPTGAAGVFPGAAFPGGVFPGAASAAALKAAAKTGECWARWWGLGKVTPGVPWQSGPGQISPGAGSAGRS